MEEYSIITVKVKKITKLKKKEDVYDIIGIPKNHNFIANNMIVHNCDFISRGLGVVYVKDKNPVKDPWRMIDFKNVGSYTEFSSLNKIKEQLKKHPNFWQLIKFPKPSDALYSRYLKVREANVYDDANVLANVNKQDIFNALMILSLRDIMQHDTNLSMNRILLHIKNEYDMTISKRHLEDTILDAKQLIAKIKEQHLNIDDMEKNVDQMQLASPVDDEDEVEDEDFNNDLTDENN